jgi:hypothetical protein
MEQRHHYFTVCIVLIIYLQYLFTEIMIMVRSHFELFVDHREACGQLSMWACRNKIFDIV